MTDVFISYAREDRKFVQLLHDALANAGRESWVDWEGIPASAKWMAEVRAAIDEADCFCFVVSPDSVESPVCREEAAHAAASNKRILPLLHRPVDDGLVPETVAAHNWIEFDQKSDFDRAFATLVKALETEPEHLRTHTRLLVRAKEWEANQTNRSYLLRGQDLMQAEAWLGTAQAKEPAPTHTQTAYVLASRKAASRRQRSFVGAVAVALALSLVLSAIAVIQRGEAIEQRKTAEEQRDIARSRELALASIGQLDVDPELAVLLALEAVQARVTPQAEDALRRALATSSIRSTIQDHDGAVNDLALTADGTAVVAGGDDGVVRVWDVSSGEAVSGLEDGHEASVMEVNVSPDGRSALSIDRRGVVVVWDLEAAEMRFRLHGDAAALSPDGRLVGTANRHGTSAVYGVEDGVLIARYRWSGPTIGTQAATAGGEDLWRRARVAFSQDGGMVVASAGGSAWVWDVKSARLLGSRSGRATIRTVSFSPDGDWVASGDAFGTVELWSAFDGALVAGIPPVGAEGGMSDIAFAPDGRTFVPVGGQPEVRIRDSESGESVATIRGHQAQGISDVAYSPDGSLLATAGGDGTARIWNSSTGEEVDRLVGHRGQVSSVRFTPEGDLLVTGGEDGTIRVWAARPSGLITLGEAEGLPPGTIYAEGLVAVSPDGGSIITAEPEGSISVFDATTGAEQGDIPALDAPAIFAGFSQDGEAVAVADVDGSVAVLAWPSGEQLDVILDEGVVAVAPFAPQTGQLLLYREADDPLLEVWTLEDDGSLTQAFSRALPAIDQDYAFAPDGRMLALSLRRPAWSVHLIDLESGETVHEFGADLPGSTGYVPDVDFNPDGSRLLMARWEGHVGVADVATGDMLLDLEHGGTVTTAEYSPDGKLILTTGLDGSAKLWDASRGEVVLEMSHPGSIDWSGFTPDGRFVWTSGQDVRLFDATSGALITVLPLRTPSLDHEFNPVTGDMVGASLDGTSWIFHCEVCGSLGELLTLADSRATRELTPQERATYLTASA